MTYQPTPEANQPPGPDQTSFSGEQHLAPPAPAYGHAQTASYGPPPGQGPAAEQAPAFGTGTASAPAPAFGQSKIDASFLTSSAVHAGVAAAAALLSGAALLGAIAILAGTTSSDPTGSFSGVEASEVLWQLFLVLTALAFSGQLRAGFESVGGFFNTGDQGFTLGIWPLASLAFVVLASLVAAYLLERRQPMRSNGRRAGSAAAAAGATALFLVLVATPGLRLDSMGSVFTASALSPSLIVVAFTTVFVSGWLGRSLAARARTVTAPAPQPASPRVRELTSFFTDFGIYAGALAVAGSLLGAITLVMIFVQSGGQATLLPSLLAAAPHVTLAALMLGHLGAITVNVPYAGSETISVFSPELPFAWLSLVPILVASLGASLVIGVGRNPTRLPVWTKVWRLPVLVLLLWAIAATVFLPLTLDGSASILGLSLGDVGFGARPVFWTPVLLGLWALAVELGAWLLPDRVAVLAPRLHTVAVRIRHRFGAAEQRGQVSWGATGAIPTQAQPAHLPVSNSPAAPRSEAPAPPRPLSPQTKRRLRIAGIMSAVAVLVVTGAAVALTATNTQRGAVAQAREYVDAIAAGNASRANELVDPNVETSLRDYVSDEMLASATERITVLDVVETEQSPTDADANWFSAPEAPQAETGRETQNVQVTYRLGGTTETAILVAERVENELLVLEKWRIITPLLFESAAGTSHAVDLTIGSVTVTPGPVESSTWEGNQPVSWVPFTAYPGIYPVAGSDSTFYSVETEPVRVSEVAEDYVPDRNAVYTPTEALETAVETAVTEKIDECAASTSASPDGCPFGTYVYSSNSTVTWSVSSYPTFTMSTTSNRFEVQSGLVSYSYSGSSGRAITGTDSIWGSGSFTVDGDVITVEFR